MSKLQNITINTRDSSFKGSKSFLPILKSILKYGFTIPNKLEVTDRKSTVVNGIDDPKIIKALDKGKHAVILKNNQDLEITILQMKRGAIFSMNFQMAQPRDLISLFKDLVQIVPVIYGYCHSKHHRERLLREVYKDRTFYCKGFYWLNYFGNEELKKQGGEEAIMTNPYIAIAEPFEDGLFVQVGETPFDCLTPEGEAQLVNATNALPPVKH